MSALVTGQTCKGCGAELISYYHWVKMTPAEREVEKANNRRRKERGDSCKTCADRERKRAQAALSGPSSERYSREELLSEWEFFADKGKSLRENCRELAPRLGLTFAALEKALERAGVRAWRVDAAEGWGAGNSNLPDHMVAAYTGHTDGRAAS